MMGVATGIAAWGKDYSEGIWIGKRNLGDSPLGLTFSPGADAMHWAFLIHGTLY